MSLFPIRPLQQAALDGLRQSILAADEEWRPIAGYEEYYEISNLGRVRSVDRVVRQINRWGNLTARRLRGRMVALTVDTGRYAYGRLQAKLCKDDKAKTFLVHRLVAAAFIGPCPVGYEVAHNDGVTSNNHVTNLRYATPLENSSDKRVHGTLLRGSSAPFAKLSEQDAIDIRAMVGSKGRQIAEQFGISEAQVSRIRNQKQWIADGGRR